MKDLLEKLPRLLPITSLAEANLVYEAAQQDHHGIPFPSHIVWRKIGDSNEPVGGVSFGVLPLVMAWFHSQNMQARHTFEIINVLDNQARCSNWKNYIVPCAKDSPLHKVMEPLGGILLPGEFNLFFRDLKKGI